VGKFQKTVGLLKRQKNKPVAIAKLNKPINASTADNALVKNQLDLCDHILR
jgi:hypothetical protein